jgi:Putative beta-lactamase-inhibitor-like, PepSY-like
MDPSIRGLENAQDLMVLMALVAIPSAALAQQVSADKVPVIVRKSCKAKFPGVRRVEWKIKSDQNYEAEFKMNGVEVAAKFDSIGKWLETETSIARAKLPTAVRATIARQFGGYKIIETQTVERFDQKLIVYEVHLGNIKEVLKTLFEENGTLVSQSSKPRKRT